jgi:hypothetical protein
MKIIKIILMMLAFFMMLSVIYFIDNVSIVDAISGSFFIVINGFLGVDLAAMIKNSNSKPAKKWQDMKMYRYITALIMMLILFGLSLYRKEIDDIQIIMAVATFGSGAMITIGMMLAGLEGNKIASRTNGMKL